MRPDDGPSSGHGAHTRRKKAALEKKKTWGMAAVETTTTTTEAEETTSGRRRPREDDGESAEPADRASSSSLPAVLRCAGRVKGNGRRRCRRRTRDPSGRCPDHRPPSTTIDAGAAPPPPAPPSSAVPSAAPSASSALASGASTVGAGATTWGAERKKSRTRCCGSACPVPVAEELALLREEEGAAAAAAAAEDIDAGEWDDELRCAEYAGDIDRNLRHAEGRYLVSPTYLAYRQPDINEKMRAILIDWLVEVHLKFKLRDETLYLTVNLLDRFLEKQRVARNKLQLVGVTALMVAAKYEEIYPPEVRDYVYICDNAYTRQQILQMEPLLLNKLGFRLSACTPHTFLRRFCRAAAFGKGKDEGDEAEERRTYHAASYLLELQLLDFGAIRHAPSLCAAAAVSLAAASDWSPTLAKYARYTEDQIRGVRDELAALARGAPDAPLKASHKKYQSSKFGAVAGALRLPPPPTAPEGIA